MVTTLQVLKAVAEVTRLRLLALIETGEVSVGELVIAMEQSQPRVSRHLKLLIEAGVVERFRDRHHVYYRLAADVSTRRLVDQVLADVRDEAEVLADIERLNSVRQTREKDAYSRIDTKQAWARNFRQRPEAADIEVAIDDALNEFEVGDLLDVRSGSGRLLMHLAPSSKTATGVDRSEANRLLARSKLQQAGLAGCSLRNVDDKKLPFDNASFDTVLMNEALSKTEDKRRALAEAARVLRRNGRVLILDWVRPVALQNSLPDGGQSAALAENQLRALLAEQGLSINSRSWLPGKSPDYALFVVARSDVQQAATL